MQLTRYGVISWLVGHILPLSENYVRNPGRLRNPSSNFNGCTGQECVGILITYSTE
jgi:hypothetical protein